MTKTNALAAVSSYRFVVSTASRIANRTPKFSNERTVNGNRFTSMDTFFVGRVNEASPYTDSAVELVSFVNEEINQLRYEGSDLLAEKLLYWSNMTISLMAIGEDLTKLGFGKSLEVNMSVPGMETLVVYRIERMATDLQR